MTDRGVSELMRRAEHFLKEKRLREALRYFDEATKFMAKDPRPWRGKGVVLEKMCRFKEAVKAFDRTLELDPEDAETRERRDDLLRKVEALRMARPVMLGLKKVAWEEYEEILQLRAEQKAARKADKLAQQALTLAMRAQKYRNTKKAKAKKLYLKSAWKFKEAANKLMPEDHKQRGIKIETFWAVYPVSDAFFENFDYHVKMLKMADAWEHLAHLYEKKDRHVAGDMFMHAAEDRERLAKLRRKSKYNDEEILQYRLKTYAKAEKMYKQAIGIERKIESGDELERKLKTARQRREIAESAIEMLPEKE